MRYIKLILIGVSFLSSTLFPQTYYMNLKLNNGTTVSFELKEINKITFDGMITIKDGEKLKSVLQSFTLFQNYPNPFNPTTTISYNIPRAGNVEITIFNVAGQLIKTIQKTHDIAGAFSLEWDAKNDHNRSVATGLYIYRARFENSLIAKKMLVIK